MPPECLTVLAPIRPGEVEALRAVLRPIGDDINCTHKPSAGRPHIAFPQSRSIHFARFAILSDPDRGADRARLLYASVFDGTLEAHAAELVALSSDLDAIWSHVEGFTGPNRFAAFLKDHTQRPAAFYIAFRDESVSSIKRAIAVREAHENDNPLRSSTRPGPFERLAAAFRRVVRAAPVAIDLAVTVARYGFRDVYRGTLRILATLDRYRVLRLVNRLTGNRLPSRRSPFTSAAIDACAPPMPLVPGDEIPAVMISVSSADSGLPAPPAFREDVVIQNQLTLVTVIGHDATNRVRAVMAAIDSYAKRLAPAGSLIGIGSIHFVRWLVIDNGRRLMMVSDYDGSWESYIDEFAEMILSGLDAIWDTALGYPPDGARDLPAFKRFLRSHQVPAEVFFSAYPTETVLNIANDVRLRDAQASLAGRRGAG